MKKQNINFSTNSSSNHSNDLQIKYKPYFSINDVYFREGIAYAFVNRFRYALSTPARLIDDILMVAYDDVKIIYSSKFTFSSNGETEIMACETRKAKISAGEKIIIEEAGISREIDEPPLILDNILFVPIEGLMVLGFGKKSMWMNSYLAPGDYLGISDDGNMFPTVQFLKDLLINTTKKVGILREVYRYPLSGTLEPYRLYVPSTYNPDKKYPLVVWLHGAWPEWNVDLAMDLTKKKFEVLAEKHGCMLLSVNGYSFGFYGSGSPHLLPEKVSAEEQKCLDLCENEPLCAIEEICRKFTVDCSRIFLCGNSMGGGGTFWLAARHSELFRAIAPCGALTTSDLYALDFSSLKGKPTLFVCGTENIGYENAQSKVDDLCNIGLDAHLCTVPAGIHDDAWVNALPDMFEFFMAH